jgi:hypothetical protein
VNFPECGQYLPAVGFIVCLFFGGLIAFGEPVLVVELEQLFQGGRWRYPDTEKILGTGVYGRAEAEVPLVFWPQPIDVLQLVAEGASLI